MIRRFDRINGGGIETINGQSRLAYALTDTADFYDVAALAAEGGYRGMQILFYDLESGAVYTPFEQQRNVSYGAPMYYDGAYYFLRGDFNLNTVTLYSYLPGGDATEVTAFKSDELELYNLFLMGEGIHVTSQVVGERFNCYYPERFSFSLGEHESAEVISGDKIYCEAWVEDGWDDEYDRATDDYKYYYRLIVRDKSGKVLSDGIGSVDQTPDGTWWIS